MARNNETTSQTPGADAPLWRVTYSYTVNGNLRSGTYITAANTPQEAKDYTHKQLELRFLNTGNHFRVGNIKPF